MCPHLYNEPIIGDFYNMTCNIAGFHLEETRSVTLENNSPASSEGPEISLHSLSKGGQRGSVEEALLEFGAL